MIRQKQDWNTTGWILNPVAPYPASRAHDDVIWAPKDSGNPTPIRLLQNPRSLSWATSTLCLKIYCQVSHGPGIFIILWFSLQPGLELHGFMLWLCRTSLQALWPYHISLGRSNSLELWYKTRWPPQSSIFMRAKPVPRRWWWCYHVLLPVWNGAHPAPGHSCIGLEETAS